MREQTFSDGELMRAFEDAGIGLASLERLTRGACAVNFKAVRRSDGMKFVIRCCPPRMSRDLVGRLISTLERLKGTKAAQLVLPEAPAGLNEYRIVCLSWCDGEPVFPDRLSDGEFRTFLDDYLEFSKALGGRIHGDFQPYNVHFANGRISGIFDLDEVCDGVPAQDVIRYFSCAYWHLKFVQFVRRRRTLVRFADAVRYLPWSPDEWQEGLRALRERYTAYKSSRSLRRLKPFEKIIRELFE